MEEKDPKTEVAEQQPAEQAKQPENNQMNTEAVMQMMKHLWPDTNEQKEKEYWRNMHRDLICHYECVLKDKYEDFNELMSNALTYARFVMNEIQAYERGDYKEMFKQNLTQFINP